MLQSRSNTRLILASSLSQADQTGQGFHLNHPPFDLTIRMDSKYVVDIFNSWMSEWRDNNSNSAKVRLSFEAFSPIAGFS